MGTSTECQKLFVYHLHICRKTKYSRRGLSKIFNFNKNDAIHNLVNVNRNYIKINYFGTIESIISIQ